MPKYLIDDKKHTKRGMQEIFLKPMSLWESKESNGEVSIMELFENPDLNINQCESDLSIYDVIFAACRGGWPEAFKKESGCDKLKVAYSYLENICGMYASRIDGVKRDPDKVRFLMRSIAENNPVLSKNQTIIDYMNKNFINITRATYYSYKKALKKVINT